MRIQSDDGRSPESPPCAGGRGLRFLFYSHDGQGLGHFRRNLAIAWELSRRSPRASILLATGANRLDWVWASPQLDVLKLPELRKLTNRHYASRRLGLPEEDVLALRSSLLQAAVRSFRPHVVLADKHPLGLKGELTAALDELREQGGRGVLGLRDILDAPETVAEEWAADDLPARIADYYERVLVYGQPELFDPIRRYGFPASVAARTNFCGYVVHPSPATAPTAVGGCSAAARADGRPLVLAAAGGGEDGWQVLETFVRASMGAPWRGLVVGGPLLAPDEAQVLRRLAEQAGVQFEASLVELGTMLGSVDAMVCMGGYNTLLEALASAVPVVCVPRCHPRREQLFRATLFQTAGLLQFIRPEELHPRKLRQLIDMALGRSREDLLRRIQSVLHFDGARHAATHLLLSAAAIRRRGELEAPAGRGVNLPAIGVGGRR